MKLYKLYEYIKLFFSSVFLKEIKMKVIKIEFST